MPAEPFDEAQAWADEAARNGDPELSGDTPPRSATPEPRPDPRWCHDKQCWLLDKGVWGEPGWLHPSQCSNVHNESGNCLDGEGSVVGWREWTEFARLPERVA